MKRNASYAVSLTNYTSITFFTEETDGRAKEKDVGATYVSDIMCRPMWQSMLITRWIWISSRFVKELG